MKTIDKAYERAKEIVKICSTSNGLFASGGKEGYDAVWARDSMITLLGASCNSEFEGVFKNSLDTLAKYQSRNGQIPNAVDKYSKRSSHVDFQSIDSSLWFLIGEHFYKKRFGKFLHKKEVKEALKWLSCQDSSEKGLLVQQPTSDWQDAFPHKYGHTINTHALYYFVLNIYGYRKESQLMKKLINENSEWGLWNKDYYYAYRWKNHNKYKEVGEWFDSLGNILAIVFELADSKQADKILGFIKKNKINQPYPVRCIFPPIKKGSKKWHDYFEDCDAGKENHYSNGGIWGFIGGFYILALIRRGLLKEARQELLKLAEMETKGDFPEWVNPLNKQTFGKMQAWEAGMFIWCYESIKKGKVLF